MRRRDAVLGGLASLGGVLMPRLASSAGRVSSDDITAVQRMTRRLEATDFARGGLAIRHTSVRLLNSSTELLKADCPTGLRPQLLTAVGDLADTVAFSLFDAGAWEEARTHRRLALDCAEQAGDWDLWAQALATEARQETWLGRPQQGVQLVDRALDQAAYLTATELGILLTVKARALAQMGYVQSTLTALGQADEALAHAGSDGNPAWTVAYNPGVHAGNVAYALVDLVVDHNRTDLAEQATACCLQAVARSGATRPRAFASTLAAAVLMTAGDPTEAVDVGFAALETSRDVNSHRLNTMLGRLHHAATPHADRPDVAELRRHINAAISA